MLRATECRSRTISTAATRERLHERPCMSDLDSPDLYAKKTQIFFFTKGSGYIARPATAHNITEEAVFVPLFDKEKFSIRAGEDLEFVEILVNVMPEDMDKMNKMRMTLPHFQLHHACDRYEEDFKGAGMISRSSMGSVYAAGPNLNGEHSQAIGHNPKELKIKKGVVFVMALVGMPIHAGTAFAEGKQKAGARASRLR
jgi:hypothetical protein